MRATALAICSNIKDLPEGTSIIYYQSFKELSNSYKRGDSKDIYLLGIFNRMCALANKRNVSFMIEYVDQESNLAYYKRFMPANTRKFTQAGIPQISARQYFDHIDQPWYLYKIG